MSSLDPKKATRAQEAVAALQKLHTIKKRGPKANSLFLDQILSTSGLYSGKLFVIFLMQMLGIEAPFFSFCPNDFKFGLLFTPSHKVHMF